MKLIIDGKTAASAPMVVQGKTYIPLEALKAAGVHVKASDKTIELTLPSRPSAEGGANQQAGVEGKGGEWLFNGIWRFRVLTIEKADPEKVGTGWMVKVEIRNGSKFNDIAPAGTGWQGISLVTEDGNSLPAASDAVDLRDMGLAQGAGNTQNIFFQSDSTSKPIRLILRLTPKGLEGLPASLRYSTPDPSFRVDIKNLLMPPPFLEI